MKALSTEKVRHLLLRADPGEVLPDAIVNELRDQAVTAGWLRGSGVLADVELRAYSAAGALAAPRKIAGPVHAIAIEGSVGLSSGDVSCGLRAVIARETDRGMETIAGEIVHGRVVGLELLVAAFDEHAITRAADPNAHVWLLGEVPSGGAPPAAPARVVPTPQPTAAWNDAIAASAAAPADRVKPAAATQATAAAIPPRPVRPTTEDDAAPIPEVGDLVEHFAFGRCDVLKSDGDRLYLRMHKDGRIKEIALEMLKVTPLGDEDGKRVFKLARRL